MINNIKEFIKFINYYASAVTAAATVVIAIFAGINLLILIKFDKKDKEYKEQTADLYEAIVKATLVSGSVDTGKYDNAINVFKQYYKGKTELFKARIE